MNRTKKSKSTSDNSEEKSGKKYLLILLATIFSLIGVSLGEGRLYACSILFLVSIVPALDAIALKILISCLVFALYILVFYFVCASNKKMEWSIVGLLLYALDTAYTVYCNYRSGGDFIITVIVHAIFVVLIILDVIKYANQKRTSR